MIEFTTMSPEQTFALGQSLAEKINGGLMICLEGDLGAGKTLFAQGLAHGLGICGDVTSPTFSLMNIYEGKRTVYHFDLYRLERAEELDDIGFYEYAQAEDAVVLIEWPDKFPAALPEEHVWIAIERGASEQERRFTARLAGKKDQAFYEELKKIAGFSN